jgi:hypothetical protein
MPTIIKQKQVRVEKLVVLALLGVGACLGLAALREFAARKLALLQFADSNTIPFLIGAVGPIYFTLCLILGYGAGKAAAKIWFAPYTTPEKDENAKS